MRYYSFIILTLFLFFILLPIVSPAQSKLNPGFDPSEYSMLLEITTRQRDTPWVNIEMPFPSGCKMVYRSDTLGLDNRWDLWIRNDSVGIISIRGTTLQANSWAEDFYAAMTPASGSIIIDSDYVFIYKLAESEKASIHTGWLTGLAYLSNSIITKINEYHAQGIKNYIIMGHSQGGAIAYLLTSYFNYTGKQRIPGDIIFKTYCSASPKPGNLFYSYDYDFITRGGWSLRIYNSEDWVPQTPLSVQTTKDFSEVNPYSERDSFVVKMNLIDKIIFDYLVGRIHGTLEDSKDLLKDYFGSMVYKYSVRKFLPDFPEPQYSDDAYYYPCGVPVVLLKQKGYEEMLDTYKTIPFLFKNHMIPAYYFLLNKIYFDK